MAGQKQQHKDAESVFLQQQQCNNEQTITVAPTAKAKKGTWNIKGKETRRCGLCAHHLNWLAEFFH